MSEKGFGDKVRGYLTKKMGNPIMPSKEKAAIAELEDEKDAAAPNEEPDSPKGGFSIMIHLMPKKEKS